MRTRTNLRKVRNNLRLIHSWFSNINYQFMLCVTLQVAVRNWTLWGTANIFYVKNSTSSSLMAPQNLLSKYIDDVTTTSLDLTTRDLRLFFTTLFILWLTEFLRIKHAQWGSYRSNRKTRIFSLQRMLRKKKQLKFISTWRDQLCDSFINVKTTDPSEVFQLIENTARVFILDWLRIFVYFQRFQSIAVKTLFSKWPLVYLKNNKKYSLWEFIANFLTRFRNFIERWYTEKRLRYHSVLLHVLFCCNCPELGFSIIDYYPVQLNMEVSPPQVQFTLEFSWLPCHGRSVQSCSSE